MSNRRKTRGRPVPPHAQLKPGVYLLETRHDDRCPTIRTQRSGDCTCKQVDQMLQRVNDREERL